MFQNYGISQAERVSITKSARQAKLQLQKLYLKKSKKCVMQCNTEGLFETLSTTFELQYNETIKL